MTRQQHADSVDWWWEGCRPLPAARCPEGPTHARLNKQPNSLKRGVGPGNCPHAYVRHKRGSHNGSHPLPRSPRDASSGSHEGGVVRVLLHDPLCWQDPRRDQHRLAWPPPDRIWPVRELCDQVAALQGWETLEVATQMTASARKQLSGSVARQAPRQTPPAAPMPTPLMLP